MIKFDKVKVDYVPQFSSLLDFTYTFNENCLLVGDELSGANTVLRLIAGFDKIYSGKIFVNQEDIKQIKDKNLNLAFVSHEPYIFKSKNLEYNLAFGLKIRKINKKIIQNEVNSLILRYNLQSFNKKMKELTLSQKKIITLLRAVIRKPKFLLLEYFFEDLEKEYFPLVEKILNSACANTLIIACEKQENNLFESFKILHFNYGVLSTN